jgi:hypothetical protein
MKLNLTPGAYCLERQPSSVLTNDCENKRTMRKIMPLFESKGITARFLFPMTKA